MASFKKNKIAQVFRISDIDGDDEDETECDYCKEKAIFDVYWFEPSQQGAVNPIPDSAWMCENHYAKIKE